MSETTEFVEIFTAPADAPEVARKLLAAAGDDQEAVRTTSDGFRVPAAIAEAAGFGPGDEDVVAEDEDDEPADDEPETTEDGPGTVVTADGAEHTGVLPASAATAPDGEAATGDASAATGDAPVTEDAPAPAEAPQGDAGDEPKGAALDAALREAGLSTEGKADEKRARLAAHRAK